MKHIFCEWYVFLLLLSKKPLPYANVKLKQTLDIDNLLSILLLCVTSI